MQMEVFDRWGGLVYKNQKSLPSTVDCKGTGLKGDESGFPWNGYWNNDLNGQKADQAVYTIKVRYRNCSGSFLKTIDVTLLW